MSGRESRQLGRWGEEQAAGLLRGKGFQIIEANWKCRFGELDLIAEDGAYLCFVEVKCRSSGALAPAREAVTASKQRKLRAAALCYLAQTGEDCPCRFDVAEVYTGREAGWGAPIIHYIPSAFGYDSQ